MPAIAMVGHCGERFTHMRRDVLRIWLDEILETLKTSSELTPFPLGEGDPTINAKYPCFYWVKCMFAVSRRVNIMARFRL